ncbi:hypothetical protein Tco_0851311 [Tanacetum coccineum]
MIDEPRMMENDLPKGAIEIKGYGITDGPVGNARGWNCGEHDASDDHWALESQNIHKHCYDIAAPKVLICWEIVTTRRYVVPTSRVKVPTGKDNVIVNAGRTKVIPAGRTILVLVVLCLLRVDSIVS